MSKLHELQAEQVGTRTGQLYEYQYHQVASATLLLLDGGALCIYCEWHDDYVAEGFDLRYAFHQVKTRAKKAGPWKIGEFFGTPKRTKTSRPKAAENTSFFLKMFRTWLQFKNTHAQSLLVTDNDVDSDFRRFIDAVQAVSSVPLIPVAEKSLFDFLVASISQVCPELDDSEFFLFLKRFRVQAAMGPSDDLEACRAIIVDKLADASEVNLLLSEARQMAMALVDLIRRKSQTKVQIPLDEDTLRLAKGITLPELLSLLSLSPEGYQELRLSGREAVRTLSRLHRLCRKLKFPEEIIPQLCRLRAEWHVWLRRNRRTIQPLDELELRSAAIQMLRAQASPDTTFARLIEQARLFADQKSSTIPTDEPLTGELMVGHALDIAVDAQT